MLSNLTFCFINQRPSSLTIPIPNQSSPHTPCSSNLYQISWQNIPFFLLLLLPRQLFHRVEILKWWFACLFLAIWGSRPPRWSWWGRARAMLVCQCSISFCVCRLCCLIRWGSFLLRQWKCRGRIGSCLGGTRNLWILNLIQLNFVHLDALPSSQKNWDRKLLHQFLDPQERTLKHKPLFLLYW